MILFAAEKDPKVHPDADPDTSQLRRFSLEELRNATNNFSNDNILGRGGFGKVYRGRLEDGSIVAVKRIERRPTFGEVFQTTSEIINMATHRNVLRLRGFCLTPQERLLVYPYMPNGSLSSHLRGTFFCVTDKKLNSRGLRSKIKWTWTQLSLSPKQ